MKKLIQISLIVFIFHNLYAHEKNDTAFNRLCKDTVIVNSKGHEQNTINSFENLKFVHSKKNSDYLKRFGLNSYTTISLLYSNSGISCDYFLSRRINAVINFGGLFNNNIEFIYSAGLNFWPIYPNASSRFFPFGGLIYGKTGMIYHIDETDRLSNYYHSHVHKPYLQSELDYFDFIEIPIGVSYFSKSGLQASAQFGSSIYRFGQSKIFFWPNLSFKLGWRF